MVSGVGAGARLGGGIVRINVLCCDSALGRSLVCGVLRERLLDVTLKCLHGCPEEGMADRILCVL